MRIAIVDDDRTALQSVEQALVGGDDAWAETLQISFVTEGQSLFTALQKEHFDALVLDRQLPDMSGDEILAWVRINQPSHLVVVMVTSLGGVSESASMLLNGADDYLTKPFSGSDLLLRLKRLLVPVMPNGEEVEGQVVEERFSLLGFEFDRTNFSVTWAGEMAVCSEREFELAVFLCRNIGRPLSRTEVYEAVYQRRSVSTSRALDTLLHRVRAKLKLDERRGLVIHPIYGFGYRLDWIDEVSA